VLITARAEASASAKAIFEESGSVTLTLKRIVPSALDEAV